MGVILLRCPSEIAPDRDPASIAPDRELRDELDLDSTDFRRFVQALSRALAIDVPEAEHRAIGTLRGCIAERERRKKT